MKLCYWEKLDHATGVDTSEVAAKKDGKIKIRVFRCYKI